ncbi:MAG: hypothetical protein MUF60_07880, partial [Vicinamibacterales bacterium]|nr:hypothetical protein [Vicinamibacterales bacterium]
MSGRAHAMVGAFEADAWAGLVVCLGPGQGAAIRLRVEFDGARIEGRDLFPRVHEVGPHDPDGRYARVAFDLRPSHAGAAGGPPMRVADGEATLTWEWARTGEGEVVGRVSAARPMRVWVEGAAPWDWRVEWSRAADGLVARVSGGVAVAHVRVGTNSGREHSSVPHAAAAPGDLVSGITPGPDSDSVSMALDVAPGRPALLRVSWHAAGDAASQRVDDEQEPSGASWARALDEAGAGYERRRVRVSGHWDGLAAS